jgi:hypothetical protein
MLSEIAGKNISRGVLGKPDVEANEMNVLAVESTHKSNKDWE